jgi:hypothetical protein
MCQFLLNSIALGAIVLTLYIHFYSTLFAELPSMRKKLRLRNSKLIGINIRPTARQIHNDAMLR